MFIIIQIKNMFLKSSFETNRTSNVFLERNFIFNLIHSALIFIKHKLSSKKEKGVRRPLNYNTRTLVTQGGIHVIGCLDGHIVGVCI